MVKKSFNSNSKKHDHGSNDKLWGPLFRRLNSKKFLVFSGLALLLLTIPTFASAAWAPPIGIPKPSWPSELDTPRPTLPSPWNSNTSGFYYVQNGGNNSGNGYPGSPRDSLPSNPPAGSVIVMGNGATFTDSETINWSGTANAPIWIMGNSDTSHTILSNEITISGSYLIFDSLKWNGGSQQIEVFLTGHHIMVRNCEVTSTYSSSNGEGFDLTGDYVVLYRVTVGPFGNWKYTGGSDIDLHGLKVEGTATYAHIVDSTFFHCQGDGIQTGDQSTSASSLHHIYIGRCTAYENNQTGFWTKNVGHYVLSHSVAYGHGYYISGGSGGAGIGGQYNGSNIWILFNKVYDNAEGVHYIDASNVYVIGNLIYNIWGTASCNQYDYGAIHFRAGNNMVATHNTIYDFVSAFTTAPVNNAKFRNNIISSPKASSCPEIDAEEDSASYDYNLYSTDALSVDWSGGYRSYNAISQWASGQNLETHRPTPSNPLFVNASGYNFRLQSGSPAKNASDANLEAAYNTFYSNYGLSIKYDFDGNQRPANAADWDVGAYEYSDGAGGTIIVENPKNLRTVPAQN